MDGTRFDAFTRSISTRRAALGGLLGGLATLLGLAGPGEATAHSRVAACRQIADPAKRRRCLNLDRAHRRRCHSAQTVAAACAAGCGARQDRCGRVRNCPCPPGTTCLSNGTCSQACTPTAECSGSCTCGPRIVEGDVRQCNIGTFLDCESFPVTCTSTADCPLGTYCGSLSACGSNRCVPICQS